MTPSTEPNQVGRRGFLVGLVGLVTLLAAGAGSLRWGSAQQENTRPLRASPDDIQGKHEGVRSSARGEGFFDPADRTALFALADVIVPRDGAAPAASEIDLLPRLEAWIQSDSARRFTYSALWPELVRAVHSPANEAKLLPQARLEAACESWYAEYRSGGIRASSAARIFEQLRRDVLRAYYSSDAGYRVLGYTGPAMRMNSPSTPA